MSEQLNQPKYLKNIYISLKKLKLLATRDWCASFSKWDSNGHVNANNSEKWFMDGFIQTISAWLWSQTVM